MSYFPISGSSSYLAECRVKHPLDARIHLFFFDEFLPVPCAMPSRTAARKRASCSSRRKGGIPHQPLGIRTGMTGDLG
jgi:hypothetical protein